MPNCSGGKIPRAGHSTVSLHATWAHRFGNLAAVAFLKRFRPRKGSILVLSRHLCVKYGDRVDLSEASAMHFIAQHTSIPVPKVHCAFTHRDKTYIVMEHIDGEMLARGWVTRSDESKANIHSQLRKFIHEMRQIVPPGLGVANVDGGSLFDPRISVPTWRFGPFTTIQAFHEFLHDGLRPGPTMPPAVNDLIAQHDRSWPPPTFTHGDLSSLNILAKGDEVVGIVDWETAGWYPSYWEYTTACQVNPQNSFWADEIDKFLDPFPAEQAMEKIRQEYFGDF
ncbi:kinase-like domain-containing protein [Cryomyces antarcticus]